MADVHSILGGVLERLDKLEAHQSQMSELNARIETIESTQARLEVNVQALEAHIKHAVAAMRKPAVATNEAAAAETVTEASPAVAMPQDDVDRLRVRVAELSAAIGSLQRGKCEHSSLEELRRELREQAAATIDTAEQRRLAADEMSFARTMGSVQAKLAPLQERLTSAEQIRIAIESLEERLSKELARKLDTANLSAHLPIVLAQVTGSATMAKPVSRTDEGAASGDALGEVGSVAGARTVEERALTMERLNELHRAMKQLSHIVTIRLDATSASSGPSPALVKQADHTKLPPQLQGEPTSSSQQVRSQVLRSPPKLGPSPSAPAAGAKGGLPVRPSSAPMNARLPAAAVRRAPLNERPLTSPLMVGPSSNGISPIVNNADMYQRSPSSSSPGDRKPPVPRQRPRTAGAPRPPSFQGYGANLASCEAGRALQMQTPDYAGKVI